MTRKQAQAMAVRNMGLIYTIANKHGCIGSVLDEDDLAQEMFIAAVDAFEHSFDPLRGTESTFLGCVLWRQAHRLRSQNKSINIPDGDLLDGSERGDAATYFKVLFDDLAQRLAAYSSDLAEVLRILFQTGGNVDHASVLLGMKTSAVYDRINRIRNSPIGAEVAAAF